MNMMGVSAGEVGEWGRWMGELCRVVGEWV